MCYKLGTEPLKDNGVSEACGGRAPFALWLGGLFSHAWCPGPHPPFLSPPHFNVNGPNEWLQLPHQKKSSAKGARD